MRTVIFDLDGTLADTSGDLLAAANFCFRGLGHGDVLSVGQDAGTALRGGRAMLTAGFERLGVAYTDDDIDDQYPVLLEAYGRDIATHTQLYPGARDAVARLRDTGYKVGICTNKPEGLAEQLMAELSFRDAFDSLVGADTLPVRKPRPDPFIAAVTRAGGDPGRALLVGDTKTDRDTSANAGVPSVLVTFGPSGGDMAALNPEALMGHYDEMDEIAARLIG